MQLQPLSRHTFPHGQPEVKSQSKTSPHPSQQKIRFYPKGCALCDINITKQRYRYFTQNLFRNVFCDITPYSPLKDNRRFGGTYRLLQRFFLPPTFTLVSRSDHYSTLKIEAISSETSVDTQRTTRRYNPENGNTKLDLSFTQR
jgi:hypothetical protein